MVYMVQDLPTLERTGVAPYDFVSDCPCVNTTAYLQNVTSDGDCTYNDLISQLLKTSVPCVGRNYGTGCHQHDMDADSDFCSKYKDKTLADMNDEEEKNNFRYCTSKFCYVNSTECYESDQEMAGSVYFPGLYYSYTTCGNPDADFHRFASTQKIKNVTLNTTITGSKSPFHFKLHANGSIADFDGALYRDRSAPYAGESAIMKYLDKLTAISSTNNVGFDFWPRSGGSAERHPDSKFNAAVSDVSAGITDMAAGMFWITSERLAMTTFTVPIMQASLYLYQEALPDDDGLVRSAKQMFKPFHDTLWILLCVFVLLVGMLNVWFSSRSGERDKWRAAIQNKQFQNKSFSRRFVVYSQLCLASVLDSFVQCFGGGVTLESESTFPSKILAFGFGFFVLISISSYTANLTSFLTAKAQNGYISSMDAAVSQKITICAPPVLKSMLKTKWKGAKFAWMSLKDGSGYDVLGAANEVAKKSGNCGALLVEEWVVRTTKQYSEEFCRLNLITTKVKALDLNIAFPVREEYSAGISHYIKKLEQNGTFFNKILEESYENVAGCSLSENTAIIENEQMTVSHMFVPICVLGICIIIACCLKAVAKKKPAVFQSYDKTLRLAEEEGEAGDEKISGLKDAYPEKFHDNGNSTDSTEGGSAKINDFHEHLSNISHDVQKLTNDMKFRNISKEGSLQRL